MTPKQIAETILNMEEYDDYLHDVELTYKVPELAQAYLALESRIQKLEAVAEAAKDALDDIDPMFRTTVRLKEALVELDQP